MEILIIPKILIILVFWIVKGTQSVVLLKALKKNRPTSFFKTGLFFLKNPGSFYIILNT